MRWIGSALDLAGKTIASGRTRVVVVVAAIAALAVGLYYDHDNAVLYVLAIVGVVMVIVLIRTIERWKRRP